MMFANPPSPPLEFAWNYITCVPYITLKEDGIKNKASLGHPDLKEYSICKGFEGSFATNVCNVFSDSTGFTFSRTFFVRTGIYGSPDMALEKDSIVDTVYMHKLRTKCSFAAKPWSAKRHTLGTLSVCGGKRSTPSARTVMSTTT